MGSSSTCKQRANDDAGNDISIAAKVSLSGGNTMGVDFHATFNSSGDKIDATIPFNKPESSGHRNAKGGLGPPFLFADLTGRAPWPKRARREKRPLPLIRSVAE